MSGLSQGFGYSVARSQALAIDNNTIQRGARPPALGPKNRLLAMRAASGRRDLQPDRNSEMLHSETYLRDVLDGVADHLANCIRSEIRQVAA